MDLNTTLLNLSITNGQLKFDISIWIIIMFIVILLIIIYRFYKSTKNFKPVKIKLKIGAIGDVEFIPNDEDIQIAHQIWTQLITRKAAIKIEPEKDIIIEVYDSWYALFTTTRELISSIPIKYLHEESTKTLISIATDSLNDGLRPHLTTWQAKYRNWYKNNELKLKDKSPQELQQEFPEYQILIDDIIKVNNNLIDYANQLKKIIDVKVK